MQSLSHRRSHHLLLTALPPRGLLANIRAENNRCARICFICPMYRSTLSVVPWDPNHLVVAVTLAEVDIVFETGLAGQRKKRGFCPDLLDINRLNWVYVTSLTTRYVVLASPLSHAHIVLEASSCFLIQNVKSNVKSEQKCAINSNFDHFRWT
jgi:hypothetical protein